MNMIIALLVSLSLLSTPTENTTVTTMDILAEEIAKEPATPIETEFIQPICKVIRVDESNPMSGTQWVTILINDVTNDEFYTIQLPCDRDSFSRGQEIDFFEFLEFATVDKIETETDTEYILYDGTAWVFVN